MNNPPVDFLLVCSGVSLRDFELSRLNMAANLRKNLLTIEDALRQAEGEALLARWLIEYGEDMLSVGRAQGLQTSFQFEAPLSLPAGPHKITRQKEISHHVGTESEKFASRRR